MKSPARPSGAFQLKLGGRRAGGIRGQPPWLCDALQPKRFSVSIIFEARPTCAEPIASIPFRCYYLNKPSPFATTPRNPRRRTRGESICHKKRPLSLSHAQISTALLIGKVECASEFATRITSRLSRQPWRIGRGQHFALRGALSASIRTDDGGVCNA
jgi:hypothetical protein